MDAHVPEAKDADVVLGLVTKARQASKGAGPSLESVAYWQLDDFKHWAHTAVGAIRSMRSTFTQAGDIDWRIKAAEKLEAAGADAPGLFQKLEGSNAAKLMEIAE